MKIRTRINMANFLELSVTTSHIGSDIISDILWEYTDSGIAISDVCDVIELSRAGKTWDYIDERVLSKDEAVIVKAFFPMESAKDTVKKVERRLQTLKETSDLDFGTLETSKRIIDGELWRVQWKEHFKPIKIGKVTIVPEWIEYKEKEDEIKVILDSNMAFGTGEHETTSMCVACLQKYVKPDFTVLDVGCGSGILGITASKLGAKKVVMTDIDECAITATLRNIKNNEVLNATVLLKNLLDDNTVKGNVIVCNIMAEILIAFAPRIGDNLYDKGIIILSGILVDKLDAVKTSYKNNGFKFIEEQTKGEWCALVMQKK